MKASEKAKNIGLRSLNQVAEYTGQSIQTLINWNKNKPELFDVVLLGCVEKQKKLIAELEQAILKRG